MKSIVLLLAIFLMTNLEPSNAAASYEMVYKADRLIESISCHLQELFNNGMRKLQNKQKEVQSAIAHKHLDDNQLYELNKKFSVEAASRCLREAIAIPQTKSLELIKRIAVGTIEDRDNIRDELSRMNAQKGKIYAEVVKKIEVCFTVSEAAITAEINTKNKY